ncbi:MAG: hypothetical protein NC548_21230 [Lachnospiraceae bacterium]|nr:hypothetical protein [Lachnospiraceae bacterium]
MNNTYVKTFEEYVNEFLIHGSSSDKVLIFDIDDTLIKSDAHVFVRNNRGRIIKELTSEEYNEYVLKTGESFSYEEFDDFKKLLTAEFTSYFNTMKREYERGVHISILTARSNRNMIHDFFMKKGKIDIHPDLIFTCGDDTFNCSVSEKKGKCIQTLVHYGYKTLIFFDDNVDNLKEVKSIGKQLGVKVHVIKA